MIVGQNYLCLQPEEELSTTDTTDSNGVAVYKIAATNDFTMKFQCDSGLGFNITIVAEDIDDTGTIRLWQSIDGLGTVIDWNTLLDDSGVQASVTVDASDLVSVFNVNRNKIIKGNVGLDFASGSITAGTVYVLLTRG